MTCDLYFSPAVWDVRLFVIHVLCFPVYLLELKFEILLIFGVQPYLKILIILLKQSSVQKKLVLIKGHNLMHVMLKYPKFNAMLSR